jgi:diaminopimelate epimerase
MPAPHVLPFVKATACGNDFLIVEAQNAPDDPDLAALSRRLCDRHNGVGADGVEWLYPSPEADVRARLFNADGSEAEISGNGTRCVAAYLIFRREQDDEIRVQTLAGVKRCKLLQRGTEGEPRDSASASPLFRFEMAMGEPQPGEAFSIKLAFGQVTGIPVSMGNPHFVVFADEFLPGWQAEAAEIGRHHDFEHGTNVEFVRVAGAHQIEIRIFERGAGETQSSGTGSCAAAVATIHSGRAQSPLCVVAPGGEQDVRWERGEVFLTGPAQLLCRGELFL